MELLKGLHLIDGVELVVIFLVCWEINKAIEKSKIKNQYMSFISMGVGVIIGLLVALVFQDAVLGKAALVGLLMGGYTTGLFKDKDIKDMLKTEKGDLK